MASKNPKKFAQTCRKLVIMSDLLIDTVNEIQEFGHDEKEFLTALKLVKDKCEATVKAAYGVDQVVNSTYIGQLSTKIDTMIRKNFEIKDIMDTPKDGPWNYRTGEESVNCETTN